MSITNKIKTNSKKILVPLTIGATILGSLVTGTLISAHQEPAGCSASGVGLSLTPYRSNGTTPVGGGLVAPGETIIYKSTLSHLGGTNCNFEGGTLSITTPDGTVNVVASPATPVVPLVTSGTPFTSVGVNYVVNYAHSGGDGILDATSNYSGGTSHTPNVDSTVGANNGISVVMEGHVIVDKVSNPSSEQDFEFDPSWTTNFLLDDTDTPVDSGPLVLGAYNVAEVNIPAGWNLTSTSCVSSIGDNETAGSLELDAGETITCTFTNTQNGNIIVVKDAVPNDAQNFTFTNNFGNSNPAAFDLDDDADGTLSNSRNSAVTPGTYAVSEGAVAGWTQTSATCSDNSPINAVVVSPGETVTCTFVNTLQQGHIIVDKVTNPSGDTQSFAFTTTGSGYTGFSLTDASAVNDQTLNAGTYSVAETAVAGWTQTSANCVSSIQDTETIGTLELDAGETITCTFTNTKKGHIIVDKVTSPSGSSQSFSFTTTGAGYNGFSLTDAAAPNNQEVVPGAYTVLETAVAGWNSDGGVCDNGEAPNSVDVGAGETITCTFTNTQQQGHIIVDKVTDPSGDSQSFAFTTTGSGYTGFSLTDASAVNDQTLNAGTYSVAETAVAGWTQTSVTCTSSLGGSENPTSISLTGGETVTCTFVNTKNVGEYCSPGYWKQSQHFDSYVTYTPTTQFSSVFENAFPGMTLVQVLSQGGGGINALGRAIVGALLNSTSMNSGWTSPQIIAMFNNVYPGTKDQYNALKSQLEVPHNCPLN